MRKEIFNEFRDESSTFTIQTLLLILHQLKISFLIEVARFVDANLFIEILLVEVSEFSSLQFPMQCRTVHGVKTVPYTALDPKPTRREA